MPAFDPAAGLVTQTKPRRGGKVDPLAFPADGKLDISFVRCMRGTVGMSAVSLQGLLHSGSSRKCLNDSLPGKQDQRPAIAVVLSLFAHRRLSS